MNRTLKIFLIALVVVVGLGYLAHTIDLLALARQLHG